jgi:hypothetical protein
VQWIRRLSDEDRAGLTFLLAYEEVRRTHQKGYRLAPKLDPKILTRPLFKQARTVAAWLKKEGWEITGSKVHWQGYIKHAFAAMAPTIPMPGQLRNYRLLRAYLRDGGDLPATNVRSRQDLQKLYKKILRPEIRRNGELQAKLGLHPKSG